MTMQYTPERIVIVGCGGIGSQLIRNLLMFLTYSFAGGYQGEVVLVDGDVFEAKNSQRQVFDIAAVGMNKATALVGHYRQLFTDLNLRASGQYLDVGNARMLIAEDTMVFSCVDNHKTRKLISDRCKQLDNVVLISGGNDYQDGNVQTYQRLDGQDLCMPIDHFGHPEIANPQDQHPSEVEQHCHTEVESAPQLVFANAMAATLMNNAAYIVFTTGKIKEADLYFDCVQNRALV